MPTDLDIFFKETSWERILTLNNWTVSRDSDNDEIVRFSLQARDGEWYHVRMVCDGYPKSAPRVAFTNSAGDHNDKQAWPRGNSTFGEVVKPPPNSFLCTDLTREGFEHHSNWAGGATAWNPEKHTLLDVMNYIQRILNSKNYEGREP